MGYNTWKHRTELIEGLEYEYWVRDNEWQEGTYQAIVHDPFLPEDLYQCNIATKDQSRTVTMHKAKSLAAAKQWFKIRGMLVI